MPYSLDRENQRQVEHWVARQIWPDGFGRDFGECTAIGVRKGGLLVAGLVYHNWSPDWGTVEMSGAATDKRWMTRPVIHGLLEYPFDFCQMVLAQHDADNPARAIWQRLGADEHVIPRLHGRNKDGVIATLTREAWLAGKWCQHGQE